MGGTTLPEYGIKYRVAALDVNSLFLQAKNLINP